MDTNRKYLTKTTWIDYFKLPDEFSFSNDNYKAIWDMRPAEQHIIKVFGKEVKSPRLQKTYGKDYKFSGKVLESEPMPDMFNIIINYMNQKYNRQFNMLLINWYRDGEDYIGMHSDDERQFTVDSPVITITLGVTRPFILKNKFTNEKKTINVENNTALVMGGTCQITHKHGLPKRKKIKDSRISITIREFI